MLRRERSQVIVPARDHDRAATALKGLDGVGIEAMDLTDPASVDAFAERFLASGRPLHTLVNSAGIMASPLSRDARGYESQFATNHLGHFQLAVRLWPALLRADGGKGRSPAVPTRVGEAGLLGYCVSRARSPTRATRPG